MILKKSEEAAAQLRMKKVVAIPTETVYGLAGNAFEPEVIQQIFDLKKRPANNPLIVHISSLHSLSEVARYIPEKARILAEKFWPGPLTLVLDKQSTIPAIVTAGKDTVGVRVPNHPLTLQLLQKLDFPLAAPSANLFGEISPTLASHVVQSFGDLVDVLDGDFCERGIESTIIGFEKDEPILYRSGPIAKKEIEALIGEVREKTKNEISPEAPGMFSKHYAPKTDFYVSHDIANLQRKYSDKKVGILSFSAQTKGKNILAQEILSEAKDLQEAARNLYAAMHRLDKSGVEVILAECVDDVGLGKTINDRLRRAAVK